MNEIIKMYRELQQIKTLPEYPLFGKPRSEQHEAQYRKLQRLVRRSPDDLIGTLVNWERWGLSEADVAHLMIIGGHGGSLAKEYNTEWHGFMAKLRTYRRKLPSSAQEYLDWLLETHEW